VERCPTAVLVILFPFRLLLALLNGMMDQMANVFFFSSLAIMSMTSSDDDRR